MISARLVTSIILFVVAGVLLLMAVIHFLEKGFLFHNAYIYASPEERKTMSKKPYYRQTAIAAAIRIPADCSDASGNNRCSSAIAASRTFRRRA